MSDRSMKDLTIVPTHVQKMRDHAKEHPLGLDGGEQMYRIACPYEPVGAAVITVTRKHGSADIPAGRLVKCHTCGRYIRVGVHFHLYGKPMEGE